MKKFAVSLIGLIALVATPVVFAANTELKIGVVDLQQVLQNSPQMTEANAQLKKQFAPQEQEIINGQNKLKADSAKLQQGASKMSQADQSKMQQQITNDKTQLEQQFITFRQNLIAAHNDAMKGVIQNITKAINSIAQQGHYDLILQKQGVALYADQQYDITDQVIALLKKQGSSKS